MPELVKNTKSLQCPRCAYVSQQRYNVFRLAALLNHYQGSHGRVEIKERSPIVCICIRNLG